MKAYRLQLDDGKYEFFVESGILKCLRYGKEWREFTGDKAVHALFDYCESLQAQIARDPPHDASQLLQWVREMVASYDRLGTGEIDSRNVLIDDWRKLLALAERGAGHEPHITSRTVELTDDQRKMLTARGVEEIPPTKCCQGANAACENGRSCAYIARSVDARIAELERALGNCRLLAMKRLHKGATEQADWEAILRFCNEAGCGPSPLRTGNS